jgi:membrane associated rhomboid family serine protease
LEICVIREICGSVFNGNSFLHAFAPLPCCEMLRPPSLKFAPYYPVTAGVALAAMIVSGMWWSKQDIGVFVMDSHVWDGWQLWRALTSTLPHVNFFHLAFNLYWLWTFGTLVERVYGHLKCAAIFLLLAFGSMLAEFAVLNGGVGLSGVGYGLWGLLMILERHDARFADAVDAHTNQTFAVWFVLCIVLTVTDVMPVANVAHGVGAVLGMLLGLAIAGSPSAQWKARAGLVAIVILSFLGGTVLWPYVNLSKYADSEIEEAALSALNRNDAPHAVKLLELATHRRNAPARAWYNLGVAYGHAGRYPEAVAAFQHAAQMPDADEQMLRAGKMTEGRSPEVNTNR